MSLQVPFQKQLVQLSTKIGSHTHNLKAFKRRKSLEPQTSTHSLLQHTLPTEASKADSKNSNYAMKMHNSSSTHQPPLVPERYIKRIVPGKRKKSHVTDYNHSNYTHHFMSRTNTNQLIIHRQTLNSEASPEKQRSASSQRVLPVGREASVLKNKALGEGHLESWINQVLIERCPDLRVDKNIANAAIKKFQVDKNSLISHGVSEQNISRIFKSLYVYSMGFNSLISEMGGQGVKKSLWKVFSILVEYCSHGAVETIVAEVRRESEAEQQVLRQQMQRQQAVIEDNAQTNRDQNERIYRENSELRATNEQLQLDRDLLRQSSEQQERAFAEEVSLRLLFESKISDLHRLYRELEIKHHKLFADFQLKLNELAYFQDKAAHCLHENAQLRRQKAAAEDELSERGHELQQLREVAAGLKQEISDYFAGEAQRRIERRLNEGLIEQREAKEAQLAGQLRTAEAHLASEARRREGLKEQYYRSLDENSRLASKLSHQVADIAHRLLQQQETNCSNAHFLAEIHSLSLKVQQQLAVLSDMQLRAKADADKIEQLELQLQTGKALSDSLQADIEHSHCTVGSLRRVHSELEEAFAEALKANQNLESKGKELSRRIQLERDSGEQWRSRYEQARFELQRSLSEARVLKEQIPKLQSRIEASVDESAQNQKAQRSKVAQLEGEASRQRLLAEKAREAFDEMQSKYRNEKFERGSLQYKYKHALGVIESLQDVVRNQNSKISQLQRNGQELALSDKMGRAQSSRRQKKLQDEKEQALKRAAQLEQRIRARHSYIHPMLVEDLLEQQRRLQEQADLLKLSLAMWKEDCQQKKFAYQQRIARLEHQHKSSCSQLLEQVRLRQLQIEYEHSKQKDFAQRIEYLELTLKAKEHFEQAQAHGESYKEKEKRCLEIISENYFKIKSLTEDLEALEDHNGELLARVHSTEKQLEKRQEAIVSMEREKEQLKEANAQLAQENDKFEGARKQLIQEIHDRQSLLSSYVPDYKSLKQSASQKLKKGREQSALPGRDGPMGMRRKVSLMEPAIITQLKEMEEGQERRAGRRAQKSAYEREDWRADFSNKLRASFGYYK